MGKDPLQMLGWTGSVIQSLHSGWAVVVEGSLAGLRDIAVRDKDCSLHTHARYVQCAQSLTCAGRTQVVDPMHIGAGGVLCNGTTRGLESLRFQSVLIFGFTSGVGLGLYADLGGAVTYST